MSTVSTFGAFTTARLGIYSSSKWLDVIGNNISNINTEGYTRQSVDQVSLYMGGADKYRTPMDMRVGNGGLVTKVTQLRDPYMDIRYRTEISSVGAMDAKLGGLEQISNILDEVAYGEDENNNLGVLEKQFNELVSQMQRLTEQGAGDDEFDTLVRTEAASLCKLFNSYASRLETLYENVEDGLATDVDRVNEILTEIRDLNSSIRKANIYGGDALEQKDARNLLIDELAEYVRIDVKYEMEDLGAGLEVEKLVISLNGDDTNDTSTNKTVLVDGIYSAKLSINDHAMKNAAGQFIDADGNVVADEKDAAREYDSDYAITVSTLRDNWGRSEDPPNAGVHTSPVTLTDNALYGSLQSERELLTEQGEYSTAQQLAADNNAATKRGIRYYMKALDTLANTFANMMNDANPQIEVGYNTVTINGKKYFEVESSCALLDSTKGDYPKSLESDKLLVPDDGEPTAAQMPHILGCGTGMQTEGGVLFSNHGSGDDPAGITAANISVSKSWSEGAVRILQSTDPDHPSTANDNYRHILTLLQETDQSFTPTATDLMTTENFTGETPASTSVMFKGTFQEMFTDFICGNLAADRSSTETMLNNYTTSADELYVDRDSVSGVDLNDETMNLMQVQKSLTAAYRLMTVIDDMLDRLINGTGRAGL